MMIVAVIHLYDREYPDNSLVYRYRNIVSLHNVRFGIVQILQFKARGIPLQGSLKTCYINKVYSFKCCQTYILERCFCTGL
ncbi:hypothetical protein D3C71_1496320 [compost metagenome]